MQEVYTGTGVPAVEHSRSDDVSASAAPVLRFERVNTFYGKSHILNDATLDVREGEIVALLGRNGAGKSTLLKTLAGLVPPSSGTIEYAGARHRPPAGAGHRARSASAMCRRAAACSPA